MSHVFRIAIRSENQEISEAFSIFKALPSKSSSRKQFRVITNLPLPPNVIVARWGSWLTFCIYFGANYS